MSYAISDIITWAKMSQAFAALDSGKKSAREGYLDPTLHEKLYVERKSLEWQYADDPNYTYLFEQGNYVLALCGVYLFEAQNASGTGGTTSGLTPTQFYPIYITQANFTTATFYPNTRIFGTNVIIYLNEINRYLVPNSEFTVDQNGVTITLAGYDALVNTYNLVIEKYVTS